MRTASKNLTEKSDNLPNSVCLNQVKTLLLKSVSHNTNFSRHLEVLPKQIKNLAKLISYTFEKCDLDGSLRHSLRFDLLNRLIVQNQQRFLSLSNFKELLEKLLLKLDKSNQVNHIKEQYYQLGFRLNHYNTSKVCAQTLANLDYNFYKQKYNPKTLTHSNSTLPLNKSISSLSIHSSLSKSLCIGSEDLFGFTPHYASHNSLNHKRVKSKHISPSYNTLPKQKLKNTRKQISKISKHEVIGKLNTNTDRTKRIGTKIHRGTNKFVLSGIQIEIVLSDTPESLSVTSKCSVNSKAAFNSNLSQFNHTSQPTLLKNSSTKLSKASTNFLNFCSYLNTDNNSTKSTMPSFKKKLDLTSRRQAPDQVPVNITSANIPNTSGNVPNQPNRAPNQPNPPYRVPNQPDQPQCVPNQPNPSYWAPNQPNQHYHAPNQPSPSYWAPNQPNQPNQSNQPNQLNQPNQSNRAPNQPSTSGGTSDVQFWKKKMRDTATIAMDPPPPPPPPQVSARSIQYPIKKSIKLRNQIDRHQDVDAILPSQPRGLPQELQPAVSVQLPLIGGMSGVAASQSSPPVQADLRPGPSAIVFANVAQAIGSHIQASSSRPFIEEISICKFCKVKRNEKGVSADNTEVFCSFHETLYRKMKMAANQRVSNETQDAPVQSTGNPAENVSDTSQIEKVEAGQSKEKSNDSNNTSNDQKVALQMHLKMYHALRPLRRMALIADGKLHEQLSTLNESEDALTSSVPPAPVASESHGSKSPRAESSRAESSRQSSSTGSIESGYTSIASTSSASANPGFVAMIPHSSGTLPEESSYVKPTRHAPCKSLREIARFFRASKKSPTEICDKMLNYLRKENLIVMSNQSVNSNAAIQDLFGVTGTFSYHYLIKKVHKLFKEYKKQKSGHK